MATSLQRFKSIVGTEDLNKYKQKQEIVKHGTVTGKASYPVYVDNREEDKDDEDKPSLLERAGLTLRGSARQVSGGLNTTGTMIGSYIGKAAERLGIGPDREEASNTLKDLERSYAAAELMLRQDPSDNAARRQKATLEPIIDYYRSKAEGSSESYVDKWYRDQIDKQQNVTLKGAADIERAKEGLGTVGRYAVDVGAGLSQMGMNAVLGFGNMMPSMIASAVGNSAGEALDEGASMNQAMVYGGLVGAVEGVAEKLFSPGKILKGISGRGLADKAVDRIVGNVAFNSINSNAGRALIKGLVDVGIAGTEEGAEEVLVSVLNPILKNIVYSDGEEIDIKEALYAGLVGFGTGGVLGGPGRIMERTARDRSIEAVVSNNQVDRIAPTETDPFSHVSETSETSADQRIAEKDSRRRLDPVKESTVNKLLKKVEGNDQKTGRSFANSIEGIARIKNVVNTLGESGAKALGEFYDGESDFDSFYAGFSRYYEAGTSNLDIDKVNTDFSKYISPGVRVAAHSAGVNDAKASLEKDINISKGATIFGNNSGGIDTEGNKGAFVEAAVSSGKIKQSTVNDLDKLGKQFGVKIHLVDHIGAGMNGFYDRGEITIALDSSDPFMTVASHEVTHHMQKASPKEYRAYRDYAIGFFANKDGGSPSTVVQKKIQIYKAFGVDITEEGAMDEIAAEFAEELFNDELILKDFIGKADKSIVMRFFEAIKAFLKKIKGLGKAEQESLAQREYGATVSELERTVELWEASAKATQGRAKKGDQNVKAEKKTEGNTQYSLKGYRNDGIEVYETSPEVLTMSWKDRKSHFLNIMTEQYRGRTAKFVRNGHAYYAKFEKDDVKKNIYGDTRSDDKGRDAKIKIGASGDIFTVVENAKYTGSKAETGKNIRAHKDVERWDYYVKTVQIDGSVFDLVANIRRKPNDEYVYSLQLNENKKIEAVPPETLNRGLNGAQTASTDSKPQKAEAVKKQYSIKDSYAKPMYSQLERTLESYKGSKMSANSVIPYLKGRGVKNEEIKWSGLNVFLEGKKSVTKDELLEFVRANQLQVETKTFGHSDGSTVAINDFADAWNHVLGEYMEEAEVIESLTDDPEGVWERVNDEYDEENITEEERDYLHRMLADAINEIKGGTSKSDTKWHEYRLEGGTNYREILFKLPDAYYSNDAMATHWTVEERGVLAHARIQDMPAEDGGKMLFIEEIQSDWHNEGQKKGYEKDASAELKDARKRYNELKEEEDRLYDELWDIRELDLPDDEYLKAIEPNVSRSREIIDELTALRIEFGFDNLEGKIGVPDAPFRDNYHEYVIKTLLRNAAENGYDSIGWTTGEIQEERWSGEYAEGYRIEYDQDIPKFLRKYGKQWGATVGKTRLGEEPEFEFVNLGPGPNDLTLRVNGRAVISFTHRSGGGYVRADGEQGFFKDENELREFAKTEYGNTGTEVWTMPITDSMRESVLYEGQPMFSIKDSLKEIDNEYMSAVKNGDMETARKLVEEAAETSGYTVRAYHGTQRADRVGNVFRPDRATSGPMAFFTDNREIAEGYSKSKRDTSIAYDEQYDTYETQFRAKTGTGVRHPIDTPLHKAWGYIPMSDRSTIRKKAGQLRFDWDNDSDDFILDTETNEANGGFQWQLQRSRNNVILALEDQWLNSGNLFNEEKRFLEVLEKVGVTESLKKVGLYIEYMDPDYREEKVYDVFLRITRPFDATRKATAAFISRFEKWADKQNPDKYLTESVEADLWDKRSVTAEDFAERLRNDIDSKWSHAWTAIPDIATDYLKHLKYDGIKDTGGKMGGDSHTVWIPFASNQVKSADTVVYDDEGNVVPLSERFDPEKDDIRFSLNTDSNLKDILKENERLKKQRDFLQEQLKISKEIKQDKKAVKKLAKEFLDLYDSRMDPDELIADLETMFGYLANERTPVWGEIMSMARQTAGKVVKESVAVDEDMYSLYTSLRDYLKSQRITLSEDYRDDIPDYNEFRKANIGRLVLVNDGGTPVDVLYERLSDMFPEYFAYDNHKDNPADQLLHIEEVLNELQGYEYNIYDSNMQQAVEELALNLINRYYDVPQAKTYADKQAEKLTKAKIRGAFDLADERERSRERVAKLRERYYSDIKDLKDHQKEKESKMSSDRKARTVRAKIMRHITPMRQKLLRPTDNKNVPKELRTIVATILDAINLESNYTVDPHTGKARKGGDGLPTKRTEAFLKLREEYQRIISEEGSEFVLDPSLLGDTADGVESLLDKVIGMRDLKLADMNLEQVEAVWQVLKAVEASISHAGKMLAYGKNKTTKSVALDFQNDTKDRRDKNSFTRRHYMIDMETPYTFFSHFGNAGKTFFRMLRNAQDKEQLLQLELAEKVQKIVSKENRKKYEKDLTEFTTENGDKLILGKDHIMELYLLSKRTQAEGHLLHGGIYQPEISRKIREGTYSIQLTEADLDNLFSHLTSKEKKVADGFQELTGFLAEKGNEATMQIYGYEKFTDPNYWPIKSANQGINQDVEKGEDRPRSIRNIGAAKPTVPNASNPLKIRGLFNTFDMHASEMICYASWLAPMEDANRIFNYRYKNDDGKPTGKTMKDVLNRVAGAGADNYWLNLMTDIQNGINGKTDESFTAVFNKVYGNVRGASVASNIRVIAQQPTAFLRAGIVLSPHYMSLGMAKGATKGNGWKKALKYAPIAQRKKIGGFEVSASPAQLAEVLYEPDTGMGKAKQVAKDLPFWGASKADQVTWGMIWNACEWQIAGKRKDLPKGSESFYTAVTELFNDVIEQSQVVDGVLQRSQIMRSSSTFMKQSTAYMGEPIMSFNLLMRNYDAFRRENDPKKRSAARKTLGRCAMVLIISNIAVAIAQSAVDALRDDDEEKDYEERFITALTGITGDEETAAELAKNILLGSNIGNTMNLATYIPILKDGVSILQGYSVERMDASAFGDFLTALTNVQKSFSGEGKWTKSYSIAKMLTTGGKLLGSSAYNVMRDVESIFRSYFIETDDWESLYDMQKQIYDVENQKSRFMDIAYQALKSGDMEAYDAIVADLIENGVDGSDIQSAMRSRATDDKSSNLALSGFNATLAAAGISYKDPVEADREADDDEKVRVENLDGETYVEYMHIKEDMLNEIMSDFKDRGFGDLDEETANNLIEIAYEYVNSVALQEATDGSYEEDAKWINLGYDRLDDVGLSEADYLMLKNKLNHTDAKNENGETVNGLKKKRLVEYMNKFGLTEEQYDFIYHELFDYS